MIYCRKSKGKSDRSAGDSILKQLIKEALETIIEDCHQQQLLPTRFSRHIEGVVPQKTSDEQKGRNAKKIKTHKSRCRNIRVLFYYAHNLFC